MVNDYDRDVFNGDQGFVTSVLPDGALEVEFPPAQPSGGAASSNASPQQPPANPADSPGATLVTVTPRPAVGTPSGQPAAVAAAAPMPPRRVQYIGRQVGNTQQSTLPIVSGSGPRTLWLKSRRHSSNMHLQLCKVIYDRKLWVLAVADGRAGAGVGDDGAQGAGRRVARCANVPRAQPPAAAVAPPVLHRCGRLCLRCSLLYWLSWVLLV